jgi:CRP-like cAMP-binding protein
VNRSLPTPSRREKIEIRTATSASPEACIATMTAAVKACRLLLETPPPAVECTAIEGDGNIFHVWFSVSDIEHLAGARTELLAQLHRHLRHAGISLGVAKRAKVPKVDKPTRADLIAQSDLFGVIEQAQRDIIADHLTGVILQPGETLIEQDQVPSAVFVVASGTLEITVRKEDEAPRVVHRMSPGESVGAIGLITGAPYAATATALTHVQAYRLDREALASAIAKMPSLREGLEALAERSLAAINGDASSPERHEPEEPEMFLTKLRNFISLLGK